MAADSWTTEAVADSSNALIGCKDLNLDTLKNPDILTDVRKSTSASEGLQIAGRVAPAATATTFSIILTKLCFSPAQMKRNLQSINEQREDSDWM